MNERPATSEAGAIVVIDRMEMPGSTMAQFESNKVNFDEKKAYAPQEKEGESFVGSPVMIWGEFVLTAI